MNREIIDINDPKVRWAQHIADAKDEKQVIIRNAIGGLDIKRESAVSLFFNNTIAVIEPKNHRIADRNLKLVERLKRGIERCIKPLGCKA
jgi:hypothetical protein